jgi:hypothetical protein
MRLLRAVHHKAFSASSISLPLTHGAIDEEGERYGRVEPDSAAPCTEQENSSHCHGGPLEKLIEWAQERIRSGSDAESSNITEYALSDTTVHDTWLHNAVPLPRIGRCDSPLCERIIDPAGPVDSPVNLRDHRRRCQQPC